MSRVLDRYLYRIGRVAALSRRPIRWWRRRARTTSDPSGAPVAAPVDRSEFTHDDTAAGSEYDAVIIGGGICGVIFLAYAREQGLDCVLLEAQDDVGGLWNWLPPWQDIQNRREDFAVNGVHLGGVTQPHIAEHVREWVRTYGSAPAIRCRSQVIGVERIDDAWHVHTDDATFRGRYLIVASGVQNEPTIPDVSRSEPDVVELHSSQLREPEALRGRIVTVVGGGASSWDLLDLALGHAASGVHWVHRGMRWHLPTAVSKHTTWPNLRELALVQCLTGSPNHASAFLRGLVDAEYEHFDLTDTRPDQPFDLQRHQLIPGRSTMIRHLDDLERHPAEVTRIDGRRVELSNGPPFDTDVLLWATGYRIRLDYLDLPAYREIRSVDELRPKLGSLIKSTDYPNLFFMGMTLIDSTSATPIFAAAEARTIVAHILGRCRVPDEPVDHVIAHWDALDYFTRIETARTPDRWRRLRRSLSALRYAARPRSSIRI